MKKHLLVFMILCTQFSFPQDVHTNPSSLQFATTYTGVQDSLSYWIVNTLSHAVTIRDVNIYGEAFTPRDTGAVIAPGDSVRMWIYFNAEHNLTYQNFAFIESDHLSGSIVLPLFGSKKYSETLYASTQNKWGEELKTALKAIMQSGYTTLGYTIARDRMYGNIDNIGGEVECVYTGRKAVFNTRAGATANNFNCEHTWPQSKFNSADPMVSDIHHLFSADETANSNRSNYPFGVVVSGTTWTVGGSKLGTGYLGIKVFEPRDAHKGDLARAMCYFIIRHQNWGAFWTESPYQEAAFRDWNKRFPPTDRSRSRNEGIALYQGNRNPFVDHPELIDRINNFGGTATVPMTANVVISPSVLRFSSSSGENSTATLCLGNTGNSSAAVTSITASNAAVTVNDTITVINGTTVRTLKFNYNPNISGTDSAKTITVQINDGTARTIVVPYAVSNTSGVAGDGAVADHFTLYQNYPNPFNPVTTIPFTVASSSPVTLTVYDVLGKVIAVPVQNQFSPGTYSVRFDAGKLNSGVYFYRLQSGNTIQTKRMVLMK